MSEVFAAGLLEGRVALVTGGGTRLGRAAATELAACRADVVLAGRREEVLAAAAERIGSRAGIGRLGREQEHAWLVALVASPFGRALSGSVITLDGARNSWFGPWPPPSLTSASGEVPTEGRRER
jgi:NAD(P)-dependent dehydrogenase (short-subunit alcohol dehydrogenase family)